MRVGVHLQHSSQLSAAAHPLIVVGALTGVAPTTAAAALLATSEGAEECKNMYECS